MVSINKSQLPPGITIESEQDYRKSVVFQTLAEDCYKKCYICEDKPTSINVEHIIAHRSDPGLKYCWNNLFLACIHCNKIKHVKYDGILDPSQCDPEDHISLSIEIVDDLIDRVLVETMTEDKSTVLTAELLNLVYNEGTTDMQAIECSNLRNEHLLPNIRLFMQYIRDFRDEPGIGYGDLICKQIERSAIFAAFKRKIVRDDPELASIFANYLQ